MSGRSRLGASLVAVVFAIAVLAGCGLSAEEKVKVQEAQLKELIAQADAWGAEVIAQVPASEVELLSDNVGGARGVSDYNQQWPRYYYFAQTVVLRADGPRTPTQMADDIEPWLEDQGWERNKGSEFPPDDDRFERDYYRDGYHLVVEVYTEPPPRAQSINFTIVTPQTDPDRR
ncbi:hypothetical protein [Microbacterium sp. NPDC087665]|uniref:hypothetical protein n=1 Tax=Microbacterium sp. NPDC087665 TaxID=3364194 RepID=UPI003806CE10